MKNYKCKYLTPTDIKILREKYVQPLTRGKIDLKAQNDQICQIDRFFPDMVFTYNDKEISAQKAREILGDDAFLSGLDRATFHHSAVRGDGDQAVFFDASKCWQKIYAKSR